jgi:SAM-dependent methyltransferase
MPLETPAPVLANAEQAAAWDGPEGDHWTEHAAHYDRTTRGHRERLLGADLISPDDDVLDVGCGTGALTRAAARRAPGGSALGIDLSRRMIEHARALTTSEGITNASFERADAQVHPFVAHSADTVVSSFGAMFFDDPVAAFANIARALRPGGRLGLLAWRELARNSWVSAIRDALAAGRALPVPRPGTPGPFGLADPDQATDLLAGAGLVDVDFHEIDEVMDFGADTEQAFAFVAGMGIVDGLTSDLDPGTRATALDALRSTLAAAETDHGVLFASSAWLITVRLP